MTREEAITYLEDAKSDLPYKFGQALDMAIEALSAPQTDDLISRADAIEAIENIKRTDNWKASVIVTLCDLQSCHSCRECDEEAYERGYTAGQFADRPKGEWVRKYDDKINCYWYECDQCGEYRPRNQFGKEYNANFCPNCGAIMRKGGEEE